MTQTVFDGGIFAILFILAITCLSFYKKLGALMLVIPIIAFLILGLVVVTGQDVTFFSSSNPTNMTIINVNGTSISTTTYHNITPSNQTTYLIGNGQFPITANDRLILGYSLILLALLIGVIFLDQTLKGNLVKGD